MTKFALSRLVLGTMTFGDTVDAATARRMVDTALDSGISAIDTANGYAGGASEEILRDLLPGRRERVVLATKAGIPHPDADGAPPLSPIALRKCLQGSLRRLGVDHVDLFYLHQPDRATPISETVSELGKLVAEGLVSAIGVSNFAAWQIGEIARECDAQGVPRPVVAQQLYNLLARRVEDEYLEFAQVTGLSTVVYNPLGGGLLTGRHTFGQRPEHGRFGDSRLAAMYTERYWDDRLFAAVTALSAVAEGAGIPLTELSLRWLLSRNGVDSLLLGGSRVEHLVANIAAAAGGPLPADVLAACDEAGDALRGPMPAYNR
ncbi:aryl-alcohol dehydrogenase-like predicted oxidoreductase [Kibdelosporangium banguiense]|uniref:Aryl-alcohol dehydrogenase-like predicted oxidoreductase n=1 Tax=Kibdelosporangium banguiense TaxID=1365924 RepID=A0ABS4TZC5_9PSEU|nr:aldo/keto reductase [Kibdelosporangium banguiense]MBP2329759.1 aryl-alcohol dehydrogenase-like predicted oxidoreductase [Kibdelosporangium banguiense]